MGVMATQQAENADLALVAPVRGTVKLNFDAASCASTGISTAGAATRDSKGQVLISVYRNLAACDSVEEEEARPAIIGLE